MTCLYCETTATASIPQGPVCRAHATEFYTALVQFATEKLAITRIQEQSPEWIAHREIVERANQEWRETMPPAGSRLRDLERLMLIDALERAQWVRKDAAKSLRITPRALATKMKRHNIRRSTHVERQEHERV